MTFLCSQNFSSSLDSISSLVFVRVMFIIHDFVFLSSISFTLPHWYTMMCSQLSSQTVGNLCPYMGIFPPAKSPSTIKIQLLPATCGDDTNTARHIIVYQWLTPHFFEQIVYSLMSLKSSSCRGQHGTLGAMSSWERQQSADNEPYIETGHRKEDDPRAAVCNVTPNIQIICQFSLDPAWVAIMVWYIAVSIQPAIWTQHYSSQDADTDSQAASVKYFSRSRNSFSEHL